MKALSVLRYS